MDDNFSSLQVIEDYLDGVLSPKEKAAFEKKLQENPALREEFELTKRVIEALRGVAFKKMLKKIHTEQFGDS